ncbi:MAG: hypothetical protein HOL85_21100 [Rhodospirillaceae bacterium]|jgi:histidine phosphotransferase ChpT|nr:hypothetical protein [Rhodospirillaceae bacterium]MBT6135951.1 hypothetical protein [Rhodospirillaceae bacterium]
MSFELRILDLIVSRICHDLVSPVSATVNGIELVEEFGIEDISMVGEDALKLVSSSARQSSDRLGFFRIAFGGAGSTSDHNLGAARRLAQDYVVTRKLELRFEDDKELETVQLPAGGAKLLLELITIACDCVAKEGHIQVTLGDNDPDVTVEAIGTGVALNPTSADALENATEVTDLDTRSVVAFLARETAAKFGFALTTQVERDRVSLVMRASG